MSVTIVNDYFFKPEGNVDEGKAAAAELLEYFRAKLPEVQLSLWLESKGNPLHHYHITVFDSAEVIQPLRTSPEIKLFTERLYPHIDHSTFISPVCDVWLCDGKGVKPVVFQS